jgi:hypothetical protein
MAKFEGSVSADIIKLFETLQVNTEEMIGEMVKAGAETAQDNVRAKMPRALREGLINSKEAVRLTKVYKTPSDDGINCQVMIEGYFTNREGKKTPAPLVANLFEYGRSTSPYPKQPFFRSSFNKSQITKAMERVQERYLKGGK